MSGHVAYLLLAPSCLRSGRFGPVLARLLSRTTSEFVGLDSLRQTRTPGVLERLAGPAPSGIPAADWSHWTRRAFALPEPALLAVFRGPDAAGELRRLLGGFRGDAVDDSLRGTFGDLVRGGDGSVAFCEPLAFAAADASEARANLRWLADESGALESAPPPLAAGHERTLVLVKPDNFRHGGGRPGQVADLFCRSGLSPVGARLVRFSLRQAMDFYGAVREVLRARLHRVAGEVAAAELAAGQLGLECDDVLIRDIGRVLGPAYGEQRFRNLIRFMTGSLPRVDGGPEPETEGGETTLALVFDGPDAVARMRAVLGPTDPSAAPRGTVRKEFGQSTLENAGHASDSVENAAREIAIVRPWDTGLRRWAEEAALAGPDGRA